MIKSDLIESLADKMPYLSFKDVEDSVHTIVDQMTESLETGERIEIRGFGAFSLHHRRARTGRNPKTGESVALLEKYVPHFKPGKVLKAKVNNV